MQRSAIKFGSSPRARGTRLVVVEIIAHERFIPAGAGNTPIERLPMSIESVHPRGRGEHAPSSFSLAAPSWFIPAGAGNTSPCGSLSKPHAVHPRGRGEHATKGETVAGHTGSSPRARGTLFFGQLS